METVQAAQAVSALVVALVGAAFLIAGFTKRDIRVQLTLAEITLAFSLLFLAASIVLDKSAESIALGGVIAAAWAMVLGYVKLAEARTRAKR